MGISELLKAFAAARCRQLGHRALDALQLAWLLLEAVHLQQQHVQLLHHLGAPGGDGRRQGSKVNKASKNTNGGKGSKGNEGNKGSKGSKGNNLSSFH